MNDRPDRGAGDRASERIADRLVHPRGTGRADRHDDGLSDTGPLVPPQRADAVPPGPDTTHHDTADTTHRGAAQAGTAHDSTAHAGTAHDDAPVGRPGDLPDDEPSAPAGPPRGSAPFPGPSAPRPAGRLSLLDADPEDVRRRWQEVQVGFVDDPRTAVERADSLLGEITTAIRTALETRASDLQSRWKDAGQADTEALRTTLRDYRSVLEQLLELSAPSTGDAPVPSPVSPTSSRKR
ncbi:hypothetical protein [Planomonospora sp. ID82291]|uniref:hypothetical protein n=1 Tax=Planomonospora sp. ID82291 TaxID=2738136 RepID=UPI0018C3F4A1|nr:hypothetical protein [Planomonospora sp. ID82291]MBG0817545.1 hypothetical protein [Planomonospora sp. ID82291]